jgi:hypothetical protein
MAGKKDMTLHIGVRLSGSLDAANHPAVTAVYEQMDSNPPGTDVVAANGDIDLNGMDFDGKIYTRKVDITYSLSGKIQGASGQSLRFRFPSNPAEAIVVKYKGKPTTVGMTPRPGATEMSLVLDNDNRAKRKYDYCLNVLVATAAPGPGNQVTCVLDPLIVNRRQ